MMMRSASARFWKLQSPAAKAPWLAPSLSFLARRVPVLNLYSGELFAPAPDWPQSQ